MPVTRGRRSPASGPRRITGARAGRCSHPHCAPRVLTAGPAHWMRTCSHRCQSDRCGGAAPRQRSQACCPRAGPGERPDASMCSWVRPPPSKGCVFSARRVCSGVPSELNLLTTDPGRTAPQQRKAVGADQRGSPCLAPRRCPRRGWCCSWCSEPSRLLRRPSLPLRRRGLRPRRL